MSLNSFAINKAVLNGSVVNAYAQSVTASSTSTFTLKRAVATVKSVSSTSTVVKLAQAGKLVTYLSSSAVSAIKAITKTAFTISSTTTSTLARTLPRTLSVASTSTASLVRSVGKYLTVTSTSTATLLKALTKAFAITSTSTATIIKSAVKSFSVVSTTTSTLVRKALKAATVTSSSTATLSKAVGRIVSITSTSTTTLVKAIKKIVDAGADTVIIVLMSTAKHLASISYAITTTVSLSKFITKTLITYGTKILNPSALNDSVLNDLAFNSGQPSYVSTPGIATYVTLSINNVFNRTLSVVQSTTTTMVRGLIYGKTLVSNAVTSTVTMARALGHQLSLFVLQASAVTLTRPVTRLVLLITTVYTTVVFHFYKVLPNIADTLIVPARKVVIKVFAGFTSILVNKKDTQG